MDSLFNSQENKRKVAIYIRVSTSEQKIDGYGMEAQEARLIEYVNNNKAQNLTTKKEWIFTDVHTGSELNREGLQKLLQQVKEKKFDAVLVWKIDRLSRSLKHLLTIFEDFEKNEVSFISVQENIDFRGPIGKLIFQIFGAIAQFERELIKGRTQMGKIASAEMGNYTGSAIPYGYKAVTNTSGRGKKLAIVAEEKKWVEKIFSWYIYDGLGLGEITNKLNELKVQLGIESRNKKGKWTERVIRTMIHNEIYRGEYVANKKDENGVTLAENEWTIVNIPPCISEFTYQQAQEVCTTRKGTDKHTDYLLSGKLVDMTVTPPRKFVGAKRFKGGYSYRRKQFNDKNGVYHKVFEVPAKQIEDYIWDKVTEALKEPKAFIEKYLAKEYANPSQVEELQNTLSSLREQRLNKDLEIARIEEGYDKGVYSEDKTKDKIASKNTAIAELEEKIQAIEDKLRLLGSINIEVEKLKEASEQLKYRLENFTQEQKKVLVKLFLERIEMYKEKVEGRNKITLEVFFKFNPKKFPNGIMEDRTEGGLQLNNIPKKLPNEGSNGATCRI